MSGELTMMAMLTITAVASVYVAWPLLIGRTEPEEYLGSENLEPALERLMVQRDTTYAAMKELEFDLAMGNLEQEDFQQLYDRYKRRAVGILKRIDDIKAGRVSPDEDLGDTGKGRPLEEARRAARPVRASTELDVEQEIEAFRTRSKTQGDALAINCPSCGRAVPDPDATFCSKCGAPLRKGKQRRGPAQASADRHKGSGGGQRRS